MGPLGSVASTQTTYEKLIRHYAEPRCLWRGKEVPDKGRALIRWPHGTVDWVEFTSTTSLIEVEDHRGATCVQKVFVPTFELGYWGLTIPVRLETVEVGEIFSE